jgi:hypothetical protein
LIQRNLKVRNSLTIMTLHELIIQIAQALVNSPERVRLESQQDDGKVIFRLFVDPEDVVIPAF